MFALNTRVKVGRRLFTWWPLWGDVVTVRVCPQVEDLTDAAFTLLHQPYEDQERSRWTWMALAPAKRRGSR